MIEGKMLGVEDWRVATRNVSGMILILTDVVGAGAGKYEADGRGEGCDLASLHEESLSVFTIFRLRKLIVCSV